MISDELNAELKQPRVLKSGQILWLLEQRALGKATLDDLVRDYYLHTDELMKRHSMVQQLYTLRKEGYLIAVAPGVYKITALGRSSVGSF